MADWVSGCPFHDVRLSCLDFVCINEGERQRSLTELSITESHQFHIVAVENRTAEREVERQTERVP